MDVAALRRVLFDLFGTVRFPDTADLSEGDWQRLDAMAADGLLQPLLHVQHRGDPRIPAEIAASWQRAHREAAMQSLARDADLAEVLAALNGAGFAPIALKGAWLARHAYPEPAQRPMLDIDLLLDPGHVLAAWSLLKLRGFREALVADMPIADIIRLEKHLPPLTSPRGTSFELHHRLWELAERLDHAAPLARDQVVRGRAVMVGGIRYPHSDDMLAHLIIHAAYSHRLDCGPRVLSDIDFLLRGTPIDWAAFWSRAAEEGWRDGARLLLELVVAARSGVGIDFSLDSGKPIAPALRDDAIQLLFQVPHRRASARFAAAVRRGGLSALLAKATGRRSAGGEVPVSKDMGAEGGGIGWFVSRVSRIVNDLARRDVRRQAAGLARLSAWFDA